jgi:hypothetical protein
MQAAAELREHLERLETVPEPEADPRQGFVEHLIFLLKGRRWRYRDAGFWRRPATS